MSDNRISFSVDKSMFDVDESSSLRTLYSNLERMVNVNLRYHYHGPLNALYWLSLCDHPSYGHQELVEMVEQSLPSVSLKLRESHPDGSKWTLVSLGPGNGEIDLRTLRVLQGYLTIHSYVCIDSSFELLRHAVTRVAKSRDLAAFSIRAICGDFADSALCRNLKDSLEPKLYSLTGFTLGNYDEAELLSSIREALRPEDFLLMDARLHGFGAEFEMGNHEVEKSLLQGYDQVSCNRFVFGPVEAVTNLSADDVTFGFDLEARRSCVTGAISVVIYCKDLKGQMRLTGEPVECERLDLASTTLYDFESLDRWFQSSGLERIWSSHVGSVGLFLLRKRGQ